MLLAVALAFSAFLALATASEVPAVPDELFGAGLRDVLRLHHADHRNISYDEARLQMYTYIYSRPNETVECIYTGLLIFCPKNSTTPDCNKSLLNCEHVVPQSRFGSAYPMKSDLHCIRPTFKSSNSARSNYPFADIPDDEVTKWYRDDVITMDRPEDPENWSQLKARTAWEPRDHAKGEVARIVAYFFTMYPEFLYNLWETIDVDAMLDWNDEFPVTQEQIMNHARVVAVQGNENPYVLWPQIMRRAYCDQSSEGCAKYFR